MEGVEENLCVGKFPGMASLGWKELMTEKVKVKIKVRETSSEPSPRRPAENRKFSSHRIKTA